MEVDYTFYFQFHSSNFGLERIMSEDLRESLTYHTLQPLPPESHETVAESDLVYFDANLRLEGQTQEGISFLAVPLVDSSIQLEESKPRRKRKCQADSSHFKVKKTGVINDPLGQTRSLVSSELEKLGRTYLRTDRWTDNLCENNDHYRPW